MLQPHCPNIIDIEASGFGGESYPIEVGISLTSGDKYCSLILPEASWRHWDPEAEKVHHISKNILFEFGRSVREVAGNLNQHLAGQVVYSDCWVVDQPWLIRLFEAAGLQMNFQISDLEYILSEAQMNCWHTTKNQVLAELKVERHRASQDALVIQETYKRTKRVALS